LMPPQGPTGSSFPVVRASSRFSVLTVRYFTPWVYSFSSCYRASTSSFHTTTTTATTSSFSFLFFFFFDRDHDTNNKSKFLNVPRERCWNSWFPEILLKILKILLYSFLHLYICSWRLLVDVLFVFLFIPNKCIQNVKRLIILPLLIL